MMITVAFMAVKSFKNSTLIRGTHKSIFGFTVVTNLKPNKYYGKKQVPKERK